MPLHDERWQFFIDRGGTFTDCIGVNPRTGREHVAKVLSGPEAPLTAIRKVLGLDADEAIAPCDIRMGTTVATNALLEKTGRACGLLITSGFCDLLEIGDQTRDGLFDLELRRAPPLYGAVESLDARLDARGRVLQRPGRSDVEAAAQRMVAAGVRSIAVVVIHAHRDPTLEREVCDWIRALGIADVFGSADVNPEHGLLGRAGTTVIDAYLSPLVADYLEGLAKALPDSTIRLMQSGGALSSAEDFRGRNAVLSGPAGGAVACASIARRVGSSEVIGFDMGGTSTDVCRVAGELERTFETKIDGLWLRTPMMAIKTIAAGGGSLCRFDGLRLAVGPHSAGAEPGPLCYGSAAATELALTDINLALGRIAADRFPFPLDEGRVRAALRSACAELRNAGHDYSPTQLAEGFFRIAIEGMAAAIREITVARGFDARTHALVVFGGAGGQHACPLADALGIERLLFDPHGGVLSAAGMGAAPLGWHDQQDLGASLDGANALADADAFWQSAELRGRAALGTEASPDAEFRMRRTLGLRYRGTQSSLNLSVGMSHRLDVAELRARFEQEHERTFGYARAGHAIDLVTARLDVECNDTAGRRTAPHQAAASASAPPRRHRLTVDGNEVDVPLLEWDALRPGNPVPGPAVIVQDTATIVVDPGWAATLRADGIVEVCRRAATNAHRIDASSDPVAAEIMSNRFMAIAEQMGTVLQRTALSTNIRERLDFSCALFDREGGLVANAPHMPVHLGAMGESVRAVAAAHPAPRDGDVFATNDPRMGGSHLPDITVVTPVFVDGQLTFYTASRGHHADVGGVAPGSMPPHATELAEEGVVFSAARITAGGRFDDDGVRNVLATGPYPARDPDQNVADLQAQIAANRAGAALLEALCREVGTDVVTAHMQHVQARAEAEVRAAIGRLGWTEASFRDVTDDGHVIAVQLRRNGDRLRVDFGETSGAGSHNLNAPRAVTVAAVLYVLRALVGSDIPLNRGCLAPIELHIEAGSLLDPPPGFAVAGGNVETSQRVVDVLLAALGIKAASQGTMNNLTFGNTAFGYYETIGGGEGAGPGYAGASGVHTHMTNTKITDAETLEHRFGVRVVEFSVRRGSGGDGAHRGGDGLVRTFEFLSPATVALLSDRRTRAPFGLAGGGAAKVGTAALDGSPLPARFSTEVAPGSRLRIETPGGGGFGRR